MTQEDAAVKLGKSQSAIANKLRLLKLDKSVQAKISEYSLTERHARALLKVTSLSRQLEVVETIHERKLNVEQTERLFLNTINKAVEMMKAAGINADSKQIRNEEYIEYIVKIPVK